ncbi:UNVERIFIED_CONTAM: hypothetical protein FKN15_040862 [Acipenser sinensis]
MTATPASTQFSPLSLSNISISSSSSSDNVGVSSLFLSAAAHPQNMQDELLLGVTTTQHHSLPSERNNSNNTLNKTAQPTNNNPDFGKQLDQQNRLDFYQLNHQQQQFSEFKPTANSDKFVQQMNNLQQELKKHYQQIHQQQADFGKKQQPPPPLPPPGEFNHFAQNQQQYQALNQQQDSPKSDQGNFELESPIKTSSPVAEEIRISEANVVAAASSSPNKAKIQMQSSNNHLINSNGSSAADNMLPAGLVAGLHNLQNQEMQNQQQTHGGSSSPSLPGFGTPWSVHTSSPPPPVTNSTTLNHASPMNQISNAETDNSFYPGIPSSINTAFFQSFSPVSANPCAGINVQGFNSPFSPQINVPQQQNRRSPDRTRMYDSLNMHSLENSLIDIMRAEHDPLKGRMGYPHPVTDNLLMLNGRSSLFPIDDGLLDDGHSDQMNSPNCYPHHNGERIERFSRKVFVGGLPPDIDEGLQSEKKRSADGTRFGGQHEITTSFRRFGHLVVDWPHKAESKSYFPPKGYAFLLFQEESSVQALIEACIEEDGKLYLCVSSPTIKDKPVQIRPWNLSDSDFVMDGSQPLDPRKTIFVGGVPRPLRAVELAMIMDRLYGGVCYAGIDTDPELKYPKGAGRVAFSNQQSYIAAISARFVQLQHGDIDKRVEVKPYVLDDQMCDECQGARCGGKFAPFFCANVTCLQYYCEFCWANIHSRAGREFHKPLVKEGADRPRQIHFRWN